DARFERRAEFDAGTQPYEQHDAHVVPPVLRNCDTLEDLVELLDLPVDLCRPDAHATRVQYCVGAPEDHDPTVLREQREVAVAPGSGEPLEIRAAIPAPVRVVPEADRHRREGRTADQLALPPDDRVPVV